MRRLEATVTGRVQGVSFRYYTQRAAQRLELTGWVANQHDGGVRVVAEGPEAALQQLARFLQQGPPAARVAQVDARWFPAVGEFDSFQVRWL